MAQTRRKRRTKHRGNAAGMIESRGRTGRGSAESGATSGRGGGRADRYATPPTWRAAVNRSAIATVLFIAVVTLIQKNLVAAIGFGAVMFVVYTILGYYTDGFIYRRRQDKKAQGKG